jgi:hypothetical protein
MKRLVMTMLCIAFLAGTAAVYAYQEPPKQERSVKKGGKVDPAQAKGKKGNDMDPKGHKGGKNTNEPAQKSQAK